MFKLAFLTVAALVAGLSVAVAAPALTTTNNQSKAGPMNPMTGGSNFVRQDQFIGNFCKSQTEPDCLSRQQNHAH